MTQHMAKGAATRHMVRWILSVLMRPGVSTTPIQLVRLALFEKWTTFEVICARTGRYFSPADLKSLQDSVEAALVAQNALHAHALANNSLHWHQLPKNHSASHMAFEFCPLANPRKIHCYPDEDMIGKMKRLMSKCHGKTAGRMGVLRYIILAGTRWWDHLARLRGLHHR